MIIYIIQRLNTCQPALRTTAVAAVITALTLAAYSNTFHASFHLDDFHQITDNLHIRELSPIQRFFTDKGVNSSLASTDFYRPLTTASFALNYALGGLAVEGYHAFNILVHILNALLVYMITGLVLARTGTDRHKLLPLVTALIFALHPVQTGAVTYISGRAVLLASFFSLSAFYAFMRFREGSGRASLIWGAAAPLLLLLGLLSKEMAIGMLGVMAAYDLIYGPPAAIRQPGYWLYHLSFVSVTALFLAVRGSMVVRTPTGSSAPEYLMSQASALLLYLRLLLMPLNQNNDYALTLTRTHDMKVALSALLVTAALYGLYRVRKQMPAVSFFGLWFLVTLAPESSLLPLLDIAVEYRLYLPSAGFMALAALVFSKLVRAPAYRAAAAAVVVLLLGVLTFNRNAVWVTEYTLWSDTARKSPYSARAAQYLGNALVSEGRYTEAAPALERARAMTDRSTDPYTLKRLYENLGWSYFGTGDYGKAVEVFGEMAGKFEGDPQAEYNLAACLMVLERDMEAIAHMEKAIGSSLNNFDVRYNLAILYERNGRPEDAETQAGLSLRLATNDSDRYAAAELLTRLGQRTGKRNQ